MDEQAQFLLSQVHSIRQNAIVQRQEERRPVPSFVPDIAEENIVPFHKLDPDELIRQLQPKGMNDESNPVTRPYGMCDDDDKVEEITVSDDEDDDEDYYGEPPMSPGRVLEMDLEALLRAEEIARQEREARELKERCEGE